MGCVYLCVLACVWLEEGGSMRENVRTDSSSLQPTIWTDRHTHVHPPKPELSCSERGQSMPSVGTPFHSDPQAHSVPSLAWAERKHTPHSKRNLQSMPAHPWKGHTVFPAVRPWSHNRPEQEGEDRTQRQAQRQKEGHDGSGRLRLSRLHFPVERET